MDIAAWLRELGLERYEQAFREHEIDAEILPKLSPDDLKDIGITTVGHRRKLLEAITALAEPASAPQAEPSASTEATPEAERRQLTVLFCDLVGSTELAAQLDPEDLREVIGVYQASVAEVVRRWEGHVAGYLGDGALAFFGWPRAHEDDAERAVRAGLELVEAVGRVHAGTDTQLAARVGIATGQVVVGDLAGQHSADKDSVVGETPNLAARLQGLAEPGTVVISQATRRLVGGLFELDDLGPQRLKGFAEPLAVWRVEGEGRAEGRFEALHGERLTPLVGREHELGILLERWAWAKDGDGQVVLLSGEPGIGKSRVIRALRERLVDEPYMPLSHYCSPYHTNSALHPVIGLLERAARFDRDELPEERLAKLEALVNLSSDCPGDVVPLLAALLGVPTGERYPALTVTPEVQARRTLQTLVDQLAGVAAQQPVLALYEDVHWIDPSTLELLGLVMERIQQLRVLVLITFRPEFEPPWSGQGHIAALPLNRLGRRQGAAIVQRLTGGKALPDEVLDHILAKTDGVPLFVEELTKTVLESGLLTDAGARYALTGPLPPLAIPATLHDSLMARLDRLAPAKEVAQTAAVIGRDFSYELVAAVADRSQADLAAGLDQLIQSELIFARGGPPTATYSFKHALLQDAAYQSLLKSKRRQLHARIAVVLEERFQEEAQRQPELLARHFHEAGLLRAAIPYAIQAGDMAFSRFAFIEARARYGEAAEMAQSLSPSEHSSIQIQAILKLAHIYQLLAEFGHMPPREAYPKAKSAALKALELDATSAEAHYVLALILALYDWDWAGAESAYGRALQLDPNSLLAHQDRGILLLTPLGRHDEAIAELERAVELDPMVSWTQADLAAALNHARRPDQAAARLARVIQRDPMLPHAHRQLGFALLQLGRHEEAVAEFHKTVELTGGEAFATAQLGWAYGVAGKEDEAQKILDELTRRVDRSYVDPLAFAWVHIALGDREGAFSWLERAYEKRSSWLVFLKVHQIYEPLRSDSRYDDLLQRLGLRS